MAKDQRTGATTMALLIIEWSTIVGGFLAASVVLAKNYHAQHGHEDGAAAALAVPSACTGVAGTMATLHAYLDGAELPADPSGPEPKIDDAMRAHGAALFSKLCVTCHGERGGGTGPTATQLIHPPANFTIGTYELRTTEHEALPADIDLFRTITRGVHGTAMPPWFALPERDRWALVAHLKTLSKAFQEDEAPPPVGSNAPPATFDRIIHGSQLYAVSGCASCHGETGRGDGPASTSLTYASGVPARPRDLRAGRFHRSTRLPDIYLTVVTGFDGTPMASFAKVMAPDDLWDVAMYVRSLAPPAAELPTGLRCLNAPVPTLNPDELVGIRTLVQSLQPTN